MANGAHSNQAHSTLVTGSWRQSWLEFALVLAVFYIVGGAPAPHINETHYLAKAMHYWDPAYCPGDAFLDSADAHLAFYWTIGWMTKWLPLPATAWVGRIAAWVLLAAAWLRLTRAVIGARWAGPFCAALWLALIDRCNFAGEWVVGGVEAKCFAYAFVIFGLAGLASANWTRPWVWFGAASAMHVLVGGWAVAAGLAVWLAQPRRERPALRRLLPSLLAGGILSLPGLLPALALDRGAPRDVADEAARIYVFERLPHHLAPLSLPAPELGARCARFGILVGFWLLLCAWAMRAGRTAGEPENFHASALQRAVIFSAFAVACSAAGLIVEATLSRQPYLAARWLRYYWFRQADVFVPLATSLAATCFIMNQRRRRVTVSLVLAAGVMLPCAAHLAGIAIGRWREPIPPALAKMDEPAAWLAVCNWIRANAPPDAVCLVPRHAQSFKWFAGRADVVNWKDVPQDAKAVVRWRERIRDIYPAIVDENGPRTLNSPEQWGRTRTMEVARRYGARYVIARAEPPVGLSEAYAVFEADNAGRGYAIYDTGINSSLGATR